MSHDQREGEDQLRGEIPVGHAVEGVLRHPVHPEKLGGQVPVDGMGRRCQGSRSQGGDIDVLRDLGEPSVVP